MVLRSTVFMTCSLSSLRFRSTAYLAPRIALGKTRAGAGPGAGSHQRFSRLNALAKASIHRSVSDGTCDWEYPERSVRDMASFGFLVFASGLIVIICTNGRLRPRPARNQAAAVRETKTMATPYPGN